MRSLVQQIIVVIYPSWISPPQGTLIVSLNAFVVQPVSAIHDLIMLGLDVWVEALIKLHHPSGASIER